MAATCRICGTKHKDGERVCVEIDCLASCCSDECLYEHDRRYHKGENIYIYDRYKENE